MKRFPDAIYGDGTEPDPRLTLANRRTFLAWIRTSLGFMAGGVAFGLVAAPSSTFLELLAAVILISLGPLIGVGAWVEWALIERALRRGSELPSSVLGMFAAASVVIVGALLLVTTLFGN